jgi:hypothetical protein
VSRSATTKSVGTSRPHAKSSSGTRKSVDSGFQPPAGASGTAARMRRSRAVVTSVVQPPKLCPVMPARSPSTDAASSPPRSESSRKLMSGWRWAASPFACSVNGGSFSPDCAWIIWRMTSNIVLPVWSTVATT